MAGSSAHAVVVQDGTPFIVFPKTFSATIHVLMERWKQRRQGKLSLPDERELKQVVATTSSADDKEVQK